MASIQDEASGKKGGEIRYLTPLNIDNSTVKKYCRFKKYGIKYVDYKDSDFLLKLKDIICFVERTELPPFQYLLCQNNML